MTRGSTGRNARTPRAACQCDTPHAPFPGERFPDGHPELAASLNLLSSLLRDQGEYGPAREHSQRALAMFQTLYPKNRHPDGHPVLATGLNNLGAILCAQGEYGPAREYPQRALTI